ncbi:YesL family protein [Streptomyces flavidovirens]
MSTPVGDRRIPLNVGPGTWDLIWSHVHRALVANLGLAVSSLPLLLALSVEPRPWRHPFFFTLLSLGVGPSLAAVFAYFRLTVEDERAPVAELFRCYRRLFRPALLAWSPFVLLTAVALTDVAFLRTTAPGPVLVPLLAVVVLIAVSSGIVAMAALPDGRRTVRHTLLAASYASVRRWPLALVNLGLLGAALVLVNQAPLIGLAVVPGCALFVVWHNCRAMSAPARPDPL